jgi:hypothetical protein
MIKGSTITPEIRAKMSLSHLGKTKSKEWKIKIGNANRGKKRTLEQNRRQSLRMKETGASHLIIFRFKKGSTAGSKNRNWSGGKVFVECKQCGKKIKVWKNEKKEKWGNFCCIECKNKYQSVHYSMKGNPNWLGGITTEYKRKRCKIRYYRNKNAIGSHTKSEWDELKRKYNFKCARCGREELSVSLTKDHIVPLSLEGTNFIDNIQPLCRRCNSIKNASIICYLPLIE